MKTSPYSTPPLLLQPPWDCPPGHTIALSSICSGWLREGRAIIASYLLELYISTAHLLPVNNIIERKGLPVVIKLIGEI